MTRVVFGRRAAACDRRAAVAPMGLRGSGGRSGLRGARAFVARVRPIRVTAQAVARARVRAGLRRVGESFVRRARPAACKMSSRARGARARTGRRSYVSRPLRPLRVFATHGRAHACRLASRGAGPRASPPRAPGRRDRDQRDARRSGRSAHRRSPPRRPARPGCSCGAGSLRRQAPPAASESRACRPNSA
ncbi:hypothetical protein BURPS1106B_A3547 [Burkholderia pseudomallei 1106b]|nr:hypothetical protein BURPS1106B_A3547 [Burkholderia pseudomallei 1106b]